MFGGEKPPGGPALLWLGLWAGVGAASALTLLLGTRPARAADITVLSAGAVELPLFVVDLTSAVARTCAAPPAKSFSRHE